MNVVPPYNGDGDMVTYEVFCLRTCRLVKSLGVLILHVITQHSPLLVRFCRFLSPLHASLLFGTASARNALQPILNPFGETLR